MTCSTAFPRQGGLDGGDFNADFPDKDILVDFPTAVSPDKDIFSRFSNGAFPDKDVLSSFSNGCFPGQ